MTRPLLSWRDYQRRLNAQPSRKRTIALLTFIALLAFAAAVTWRARETAGQTTGGRK